VSQAPTRAVPQTEGVSLQGQQIRAGAGSPEFGKREFKERMIREYQNKLIEQNKHRYVSSLPVVRISSSSSKLLLNNPEHARKRH
jgi:hypothetical protein